MTSEMFAKQIAPALSHWRVAFSDMRRRPDVVVRADSPVITSSGDVVFYMSAGVGAGANPPHKNIPLFLVARGDWETVSLVDPISLQSVAVSSLT